MNVIDSLVVELGLNSKQFVEGIKGATESLGGFAMKALALAGVVTSIEGVITYFKDLEQHLANVGYEARNLGVAGVELSRLGEVAQLFGGSFDDAAASVQSLQAAVFNLQFKGQMSDQLAMLQRFHIPYLTAEGHARDVLAIAQDAAHLMDRLKAGGMDQGMRMQLAMSFGLQGGEAAAAAGGSEGFADAWKKAAEDQKRMGNGAIDAARRIDQSFTRLDNTIAANLAPVLQKLEPDIVGLTTWIRDLAATELPKIPVVIDSLKEFLRNPPPWLKDLETDFTQLRKTLENPPPWLKRIEDILSPTKDGGGGSTVGHVAELLGGAGLAGWLSKLVAGAGLRAAAGAGGAAVAAEAGGGAALLGMAGIATLVTGTGVLLGYLMDKLPGLGTMFEAAGAKVSDAIVRYQASNPPAAPWQPGGGWIPAPREGVPRLLAPPGTAAAPPSPTWLIPAPPTPNAPRPAASGSSGIPTAMDSSGRGSARGGTVIENIDVTVNTKATDAYAMAGAMSDALNRKLLVASADRGLA